MTYKNILPIILIAVASCGIDKEEKEIESTTLRFAQCFFECEYKEAAQLCTAPSEKWIRFVASNVSDSDLIIFNQAQTTSQYTMTDLTMADDTTAVVKVRAENYLYSQSIGEKSVIKPQGQYTFTLFKRGNVWKINLPGVPQEDKESY